MKKNGSKQLKLILSAAIVAALGFTIVFYFTYRRVVEKSPKLSLSLPAGADLSIGDIHQTATRDGVKEWELDAAAAHYLDDNKRLVLEDLLVTFFLKNRQTISIEADHGILQTESRDIQVMGNVVVMDQQARLLTDALSYEHRRRLITSTAPVKIIGNSYQLAADKLFIDLNANKTVLEGNVRGSFTENFQL